MSNEHQGIFKIKKRPATKKKIRPEKPGNAQHDGKNIGQRRQRAIVRGHGRTLTSSIQPIRLASLKIAPKLRLEIIEEYGIPFKESCFRELKENISVLSNVIQAGCKQLKNPFTLPEFNKEDPISKALKEIFMNFYNAKFPGSEFTIEGENNIIAEYFPIYLNERGGACLAIGIIDDIKEKSSKLPELMIRTFRLLSQKCKFNFASPENESYGNEDLAMQIIGERLSIIEDDLKKQKQEEKEQLLEEKANIEDSIKKYKKGGAAYYYNQQLNIKKRENSLQLIQDLRKHAKKADQEFCLWAIEIIKLVNAESYTVHTFDHNSEDIQCNDGYPVFFSQYVGFYYLPEDYYFKELDYIYEQTANQAGVSPPTWLRIWSINGISGTVSNNDWPLKIYKFFVAYRDEVLPKICRTYELDIRKYRN